MTLTPLISGPTMI